MHTCRETAPCASQNGQLWANAALQSETGSPWEIDGENMESAKHCKLQEVIYTKKHQRTDNARFICEQCTCWNCNTQTMRQQWRAARAANPRPQAANVTAFALFCAAKWAQNCMALPSTINNIHVGGGVSVLVSRDDHPTWANLAQNTMFASKGARIRKTHQALKGTL